MCVLAITLLWFASWHMQIHRRGWGATMRRGASAAQTVFQQWRGHLLHSWHKGTFYTSWCVVLDRTLAQACAQSCSASSSLLGGFGPGADWEGSFMCQAEKTRPFGHSHSNTGVAARESWRPCQPDLAGRNWDWLHCFSVFELVGTHSRRRRDLLCYETYDCGVFMDFWSWNILDFTVLLYRLIQYDSILEHWSHYRS